MYLTICDCDVLVGRKFFSNFKIRDGGVSENERHLNKIDPSGKIAPYLNLPSCRNWPKKFALFGP